ncbi:MAG: hypothetical protein ABW250_05385 [Pyrinomonadaceae bacterium]
MSESAHSRPYKLLPLAITRAEGRYGCIGAVGEDGGWLRPEPIYVEDVESPDGSYRYFHWTEAHLTASSADDARPEDRDLCEEAAAPRLLSAVPEEARLPFLAGHADEDVASAFAGGRSLGLVEVGVKNFYVKRATGGRSFVRGEFSDRTGEVYDWIIPEIAFGRVVRPHVDEGVLEPAFVERLLLTFGRARTFFTVGLTKPNFRFPGKFRDCHPLVVGIHSGPDYVGLLKDNDWEEAFI